MADKSFNRPGANRGAVDVDVAKFRDNSDGSYDLQMAANLWAYDADAGTLGPVRLAVDHATGGLKVFVVSGSGEAVTVASGADVVEGATNDAAIITDTTGTVNGKLRGLVKWAFERMPAALGQTTMSASLPVALASNQSAIPVTASWASAQHIIIDSGTLAALTDGTLRGAVTVTNATASNLKAAATLDAETTKVIGTVNISASQTVGLAAGSQVIGHAIIDSGTVSTITNVVHVDDNSGSLTVDGTVSLSPATSGGWSIANCTSGDTFTALTNSAQVIKGSAGQLGGWYIYNPNTAAAYVNIYNIAAASVTVGTSTPALNLTIPPQAAANIEFTNGIAFATAISASATTTGGGATAPTTALEANFLYK